MPHQILPGSLEIALPIITAGVHTGNSEWDIQNLRYVSGNAKTQGEPKDSIADFLTRIYDNSEGCLVTGTFKMKE